ncbi:tetratricopeptide repeat protein [Flavobacterium sufflavum]|uniref:Tetratricopeptide repeat protein n=1 Tax=Flavobacterium sufflavum TaxID=1921138 RepID=A0A3S2WFR3_9FLAO|nr:T9SS type A sorting domain-containing protein [Flavobacterium sufflavum]RVT78270.1 tetratricopeptide repeat protein [Flavobacterium sufflavum]
MNIKILSLFLFPVLSWSQIDINTKDYKRYYKDKVISMEVWKGSDKIMDSMKTYHSNGKINEVFYFDDKGRRDSYSFQYNDQGEKLVTWNFSHGKLLSRTDHKLPFNNKETEENAKKYLQLLTELNTRTNYNPTNLWDLFNRGDLRARLGNRFLALDDLRKVEWIVNKNNKDTTRVISEAAKRSRKNFESTLYDIFANLYGELEMENAANQYYVKAMAAAPEDYRILYNFGNYLLEKKSTDLARYYLEKIVAVHSEHGHARWGLARLYSDIGEYKKAMESITIAFKKEKAIIAHSSNYGGRDLRTTRGLLYHKLGESEKGIQDLKEALKMDKNNSYAMKNLGIIYLDQKKYSRACELFEKAKALGYTLVYDENDLATLIESACNNVPQVETVSIPKPFVFPNPATTVITIKNYDYKNFDYDFFDFESNAILHGKSTDGTIDVSKLNTGFYILKISNTDSPQTFKIIKE